MLPTLHGKYMTLWLHPTLRDIFNGIALKFIDRHLTFSRMRLKIHAKRKLVRLSLASPISKGGNRLEN